MLGLGTRQIFLNLLYSCTPILLIKRRLNALNLFVCDEVGPSINPNAFGLALTSFMTSFYCRANISCKGTAVILPMPIVYLAIVERQTIFMHGRNWFL